MRIMMSPYALLITITLAAVPAMEARHLKDADPVVRWYTQFSVGFNESTKIIFKRSTEGVWMYDAVAQAELTLRDNGNGDRYCGSIHPLTSTPCSHLVVQRKHYLIFPELQECCMCCTAEKGCGLLSPTWLDDAQYQGVEEVRGVSAYKWMKKGLQPNYWYATADDLQLPVELDQMPNDLQSFHLDTFAVQPIEPQLLEIPPNCHSACPISSVCTIAQPRAAVSHVLSQLWGAGGAVGVSEQVAVAGSDAHRQQRSRDIYNAHLEELRRIALKRAAQYGVNAEQVARAPVRAAAEA